jgi:rhodanese-related sulfurtransferase
MKINLSNVFYIIIVSSIIGLLINFLRPDGISLSRKEKQLVWADSIINLKKNTERNDKTSLESFKEPIAINLKQAYELYKKNIVFLDARGNDEYKEGHIKNALSLPYYDFDSYKQVLNNIPKSSIIVTYCAGTDCDLSILLGKQLFESGYKKIYIFFGGWNDWLNANYPIERS